MIGKENFAERIKNPEEQIEQCRQEMMVHLQKLGYSSDGVIFIMENFDKVLALYNKPEIVWQNMTDNFKNLIRYPFGEKDFLYFMREIDPSYITNEEINFALGVIEFDIKNMDTVEKKDFEKDRKEFIEEEFEKRSKNVNFLKDDGVYRILKAYTEPKGEHLNEAWPVKFIYTPFGGQSGYRIKFKRK
jgi:hypothetical protein